MKTTITELQDFVVNQAAEDAVLSSSEKRYQAQLVADVLGQEAPNSKALKKLLALYRSQRQLS
jgi:hypothetical protein